VRSNPPKVAASDDPWPPVASPGWTVPVPLPYPINTTGGEDSPFILPDGLTLYFFFTPDVRLPVEKQLADGLTGIWITRMAAGNWSVPERVWLSPAGMPDLDGCEFVLGDLMYFCTIRTGLTSIRWFKAEYKEGSWQNWQDAGGELKQDPYQVGELHVSADGSQLFFHSPRPGGLGGLDIWESHLGSNGWEEPVNLGPSVNTPGNDGWPCLSWDGTELWFNSDETGGIPGPAIYRSRRQPDGSWGPREQIIASFAGEPTLDKDGMTLYFVHHIFSQDMTTMLDADIYVSRKIP
jgi:hypothetical protein